MLIAQTPQKRLTLTMHQKPGAGAGPLPLLRAKALQLCTKIRRRRSPDVILELDPTRFRSEFFAKTPPMGSSDCVF
jgi:hypothetical protein